MTAIIYTKPGCPYCAAAKNDLVSARRRLRRDRRDGERRGRETLAELTGGSMVVPVLVEGDDVRVGFGGG